MNAKAWWKSRTLIFNAIAALAAVLPQLEASLPVLQAVLPDHYYAGLSGAVVVGNVALRLVTTTAVALRDGEPWP